MPLDDLWALHEQLTALLSKRILAEKRQLENRLVQLNRGKIVQVLAAAEVKSATPGYKNPRRPYAVVIPKYQNPAEPSETWSGRGKQPRWLVSALKAGGRIEDFRIPDAHQGKVRAQRSSALTDDLPPRHSDPTGTKGEELKAGFRAAGRASGLSVDLRVQCRYERDAEASGFPLEVVAPIIELGTEGECEEGSGVLVLQRSS